MKKINFNFLCIFFLTLSLSFPFSCFSLDFSEDKKVNKLINNFYKKGNYYHCDYEKSYSSGYKNIPSGFTNEPEKFGIENSFYVKVSRMINLVEFDNTLGVILEETTRHVRRNFIYDKVGGNKSEEYQWCRVIKNKLYDYVSGFDDRECYSNWSLLFDGSILKINPNKTYFRDYYRCSKIDLTSIEKERLVRRFLDRYSKGE